jgi:O-antigen/teichoic acid export membrane protein
MARLINKADIFWGYAAQALNIGAGLLLLPIVLVTMKPADVGIWFVFITLGSLAQLLEFGFQPTLARNTSYVFSGAKHLIKEGVRIGVSESREINIDLLANLISSCRKIYRRISLLTAIFMLGLGSIYILSILVESQSIVKVMIAWVLFSLGYVSTFYFGYINALLMGRGDVTQANKVIAVTKASLIIICAVFLIIDLGLIGLGAASLVSAVIGRAVAIRYFKINNTTKLAIAKSSTLPCESLTPILWHNAKKMALVQLCAFIIQKGNILIGTSILGPETSASYSMTLTVLMTLSSVSSVICQIQLPRLNSLQLHNEITKMRQLYLQILIVSIIIFVTGSLFIGAFANKFLSIIGSEVYLLQGTIYYLFAFIILLEMNHAIAATYLTTLNEIPFFQSAIISAVFTLILSMILVNSMSINGLVYSQGIIQLLYNNWKWPFTVYHNLYKVR